MSFSPDALKSAAVSAAIRRLNPDVFAQVQPAPVAITPATTPIASPEPRGRKVNKAEAAYARYLDSLAPRIKYWSQSIGICLLRGKDRCYSYPDFAVLDCETMRLHFVDVKAAWNKGEVPHIEDDALVKLKWVAVAFAPIPMRIAWLVRGEWRSRNIEV